MTRDVRCTFARAEARQAKVHSLRSACYGGYGEGIRWNMAACALAGSTYPEEVMREEPGRIYLWGISSS